MNTIQLNIINYSPVFLLIIFTFGAYQNLTFMQFIIFIVLLFLYGYCIYCKGIIMGAKHERLTSIVNAKVFAKEMVKFIEEEIKEQNNKRIKEQNNEKTTNINNGSI